MVDSSSITLASLFLNDGKGRNENKLTSLTGSVIEAKLKNISTLSMAKLSDDIREQTTKMFDVTLEDIVSRAWEKLTELRKYQNKQEYPSNKTTFVELSEHTIQSNHSPYIEVLFNNKPVARVTFTINVTLTLKGVLLKIRDGKIWEVKSGKCALCGSLSCADQTIFNKKVLTVDLPGAFELKHGAQIPI